MNSQQLQVDCHKDQLKVTNEKPYRGKQMSGNTAMVNRNCIYPLSELILVLKSFTKGLSHNFEISLFLSYNIKYNYPTLKSKVTFFLEIVKLQNVFPLVTWYSYSPFSWNLCFSINCMLNFFFVMLRILLKPYFIYFHFLRFVYSALLLYFVRLERSETHII
jgi:hypothetical protein